MKVLKLLISSIFTLFLTIGSVSAQTTITSAFSDFGGGNIDAFELGGDATLNGSELRLTRAVNAVFGTAYYTKKVNLINDRSFSAHFSFKMTNPTCFIGDGADGIGFVIQQTSNTAGSVGGGLGYAGVTPSFVVEFDTFDNGAGGVAEPDNNHIGININGDVDSVASFTPGSILNSGATYYAWVDYNGASDTVEVRFNTSNTRPGAADLSYSVDLAQVVSSDVFVGFSAATGGCNETHEILSFYFNNDVLSGGITPGSVTYTSAPTEVAVTASAATIIGNGTDSSTVTATVLNVDGSPASGVTVQFTTSLGTLSASSAVTNSSGQASVILKSTSSGTAAVRAQAQGGAFGTTNVSVSVVTATPTPSVPSTQIEGQVIVDGQPVVNALIYIPGVGTALTDAAGKFVITNVTVTGPLQAYVQRTGIVFDLSSLTITPGQFAIVNGTHQAFNPLNCEENDITVKLHNIATQVRTLLEVSTGSTGKLPLNFDFGDGRSTTREKSLLRLSTQFDRYLNNSRLVPEIALTCGQPQCTTTNHKTALAVMKIEVKNLKREGLFASRLRKQFNRLSADRKLKFQNRVRRLGGRALKMIESLPKKSANCPVS